MFTIAHVKEKTRLFLTLLFSLSLVSQAFSADYFNSGNTLTGFTTGYASFISTNGTVLTATNIGGWCRLPISVTGNFVVTLECYADAGDADGNLLFVNDSTAGGYKIRFSPSDTDTPQIEIAKSTNFASYYAFYFPSASLSVATTNFVQGQWTAVRVQKSGTTLEIKIGNQTVTYQAADFPATARVGLGYYATHNAPGNSNVKFRNISVRELGAEIGGPPGSGFENKYALRKDPTKSALDAIDLPDGQVVYSGNGTGDYVLLKAYIPQVEQGNPPAHYKWQAKHAGGAIQKGPDSDSWEMQGVAFGWAPGQWTVSLEVTLKNGSKAFAEDYLLNVGWRTEGFITIGQIVKTGTYTIDTARYKRIAQCLIDDMPNRAIRFPFGLPVEKTDMRAFALLGLGVWGDTQQGLTAALFGSAIAPWSFYYGTQVKGPVTGAVRGLTYEDRLFVNQTLLNSAPDALVLADKLTDGSSSGQAWQTVKESQQYRILSYYQEAINVNANGTADSVVALESVVAAGKTKKPLASASFPVNLFVVPFPDPSPAENNCYTYQINAVGEESSHYASARIGIEGQYVGWHLFGRSVPWIWVETLFKPSPDHTKFIPNIRTAVNTVWPDQIQKPFNNINIYRRDYKDRTYPFKRVSVLSMEGSLDAFIAGGSLSFPGPPSKPFLAP